MGRQMRKLWILFLLLVLLSLGSQVPVMADTNGPVFGNTIPSEGRVISAGSYLLEVSAYDQDNIDPGSVQLLINGQSVNASFDYDVASVDPVAETETYDYTRGTVSYRQRFLDNTYNIEVRLKDSRGNLSVKQWKFEVRSSLNFSSMTPAPLSSLSNRTPGISAKISSPGGPINPASVQMLINGEAVLAYFDPFTGQVSYTPMAPLIPGFETAVTVIASDMNGLTGRVQWNFTVSFSEMPASNKQECLKCHSNMPQQHKMENCSACHNVALRNIYKDNGTLPHFVAESCYKCHYTASHDKGAIADVPAWWPIDQLYSCEQCHSHSQETVSAKHQSSTTGNCQQCHNMQLTEEHFRPGRLDKNGNSIDCYTCHNSTNLTVKKAITDGNTSCEVCHTTVSHSTVHTNTALTSLAKDPDMNCAGCHSSTVSDEHLSGRFTSGKGYTCDTCHSSSRPEVKAAIAAKNLNCEACHIDSATGQPKIHTTSGSPLHDSGFVINKDSDCQQCHASNLKDVHVGKPNKLDNNNLMSCATCHDSSNPAIMAAIGTKNTQCDACHIDRHGTIDHSFPAGYVLSNPGNMNCAECHQGTGLTDIHVGKNTKAGDIMSCNTCHGISAPDNVKTAIASGTKNCDACHVIHQDTASAHSNTNFTSLAKDPDMNCAGCHSSTVSDEHLSGRFTSGKGYTCAICHSSSRAEVKAAIAAKNLNCEACHIDSATGQPKIHTTSGSPLHDSGFVINKDSDCQQCHASNLKDVHVGKPNKLDNNNLMSCATCHDSSNPTIMAAIGTKNTQCDACHIDRHGTIDHSFPAGYVLSNPGNMNCAECHQGTGLTDIHVGKNTKAGDIMSCNTCHGTSAPDNVKTAIASGTKNCDACHVIHQDTNTAHVNPGFTTLTFDQSMNCSGCHNNSLSDEHISGKITLEKGYTCGTCHNNSRPEVKAAITSKNLNCEACHSKVHTSPNPYHATTFVANKNLACEKCHDSTSIANDHGKYKTVGGQAITCATCHESSDSKVKNAILSGNTGCDSCHATRHMDVQAPHQVTYIPNTTYNCINCHTSSSIGYNLTGSFHRVTGVTPNTNLLHGGAFVSPWISTSSVECRGCHGKNPSTGVYYGKLLKGNYTANTGKSGYTGTTELCFICHKQANYAGYSNNGGSGYIGEFSFSNLHTSNHGYEGCQFCHSKNVHSSALPHFIALYGPNNPNSGLSGFEHQTYYSYNNLCGTCHE